MTPTAVAAASIEPVVASLRAPLPAAASGAAAGGPSTILHANPVSLLDPSTGLVVLEFYNAKGEETASLPTKKQLDLYRLNEPSPDVFEPAIRDSSTVSATSQALPKEA